MSLGRRLALVLGALALLAVGFAAGARFARRDGASARDAALYRCPMHPAYTSDRPGTCPICQMSLVRADARGEPGTAGGDGGAPGPPVAGRATVVLTPERRQLLGVRSEAVRRVPLERTIRTVGRLAVDERRVQHVHARFEGYVEHVHVGFTGQFVEAGAPLASLSVYDTDLLAAQQEYLLAHRGRGEGADAEGGRRLAAARQRLARWDVGDADIARLEQAGEVQRTLDLRSERSGYVVAKTAVRGMRVTPDQDLFDVADLDRLWVLADVYEHDLAAVRVGMAAEVSLPYLPGKRWQGPVTYVAPVVDERTRTIEVRVELENRGGALKPDMYADVFLRAALGPGLAVNESAVIDAGDRRLVFLDRGQGRYEPREVTLGAKAGDFFQVLSGLDEGDLVVTSANFLLDSESSLRAVSGATPPSAAPARR